MYRGRGGYSGRGGYRGRGGYSGRKETPQAYALRKRKNLQKKVEWAKQQRKFEFINTILRWSVSGYKLNCPEEGARLPILSQRYTNRMGYYNNFKPLILEESRAITRAGLEQCQNGKVSSAKLTIHKCQHAKNQSNPSTFIVSGYLTGVNDYSNSVIVLSELKTGTILLANITDVNRLHVKAIVSMSICSSFKVNSVIKVYPLCSLVTQKRMYDTCVNMPVLPFEQQIFYPKSANISFAGKTFSSSMQYQDNSCEENIEKDSFFKSITG